MSDPLRALRLERDRAENQRQMAAQLHDLADLVASGALACEPDRFAVVFAGAGDVHVTWGGRSTFAELRLALLALSAGVDAVRRGEPPVAAARDDYQRRLETAARQEADRAADAAKRPWRCDFCVKRYTTQGRAEAHERSCWQNPDSRHYGPDGDRVPHVVDGRVVGWSSKEFADQAAARPSALGVVTPHP